MLMISTAELLQVSSRGFWSAPWPQYTATLFLAEGLKAAETEVMSTAKLRPRDVEENIFKVDCK
jgi:hypothetical protein